MASNKETIWIQQEINYLKEYRKSVMKKCVSTTHIFTVKDFLKLGKELSKRFKTFKVEFKEDKVEVTIPTFGRRI